MAKTFSAKSACVRAIESVTSHMYAQCVWTSEFPAAYRTFVFVDIIVNNGMVVHLVFGFESTIEKDPKYVTTKGYRLSH